MSGFKVVSGLGRNRMLRKKIKNLSEIFGSFVDNCYFCSTKSNKKSLWVLLDRLLLDVWQASAQAS